MNEIAVPARVPGACPVCGARSLAPEGSSSALVAVCDVLVIKCLEQLGKRIVRSGRTRYAEMDGRPWSTAHTIWRPTASMLAKVLESAWDVVPAMLDTHGCCGVTSRQVSDMLSQYTADLVVTGTPHTTKELAYRFESRLGLPVYLREAHSHD